MRNFEAYLIEIGIRSIEFTYTNDELFSNIIYFKRCWEVNLSPYKALTFLNYLEDKKLSFQEWNRLMTLYTELKSKYPEWRSGQALFNALYMKYPHIADKLRGTVNDPFYNDDNIKNCLEILIGV